MIPRLLLVSLFVAATAAADGPADNLPDNVRRQPPPGVAIPDAARASLTAEAARLAEGIAALRAEKVGDPLLAWLPDVQVFHKAVDWALRYDEFFDPKQADWAARQLALGFDRLEALRQGKTPWLQQTGLVPRGYLSKIDRSVQPFGLVVPESFEARSPHRWRLDCWFHGRGEKLTELDFLHQRLTNRGEFAPRDAIVLHPYGRYCNGSRFAGESDFFEALEVVKRDYRIDDDRIVVRGFSLGGAACWHIATHHAWQWCAANPGAGFSETEKFLRDFQGESLHPRPWERKLWNLYDSTTVADNLFVCPTVAYSGEIDKQKQAADLMAEALADHGMALTHIVGPGTAHAWEPGAKAEVARRIDAIVRAGRPRVPASLRFRTFTLATNRCAWLRIDGLAEHWTPSAIRGRLDDDGIRVALSRVTGFSLLFAPGTFRAPVPLTVHEDGNDRPVLEMIAAPPLRPTDGSLEMSFARQPDGTWEPVAAGSDHTLRKKHGLQGPVDDAFTDSFVFVRPTGQPASPKAAAWAEAEMTRAIEHWRRHFRGDARVIDDTDITPDDIASAHLVLWGDPASNRIMAKVAPEVPVAWQTDAIVAGSRKFGAADHALICIYPNPLNPDRYVVFNSGFTFREYDYLNNARQTPKLPDWAVVDLNSPPTTRTPGAIPAAGFFGERWEWKEPE